MYYTGKFTGYIHVYVNKPLSSLSVDSAIEIVCSITEKEKNGWLIKRGVNAIGVVI